MGNGVFANDNQLIQLMITLPSALVIAFAILMIVYRMIDTTLHVAVGFGIIGLLFVTLYLCVWPPHPIVPAIALVVVVGAMVMFPFAESYLEKILLEEIDVDRLERALKSWHQRPDNIAAQLALAEALEQQGFRNHAIALAKDALSRASTKVDDVRNTSIRDMFRKEDYALRQWEKDTRPAPTDVTCQSCGHSNPPNTVFCLKCERPFILDLARGANVGPAVFTRLALTSAIVCAAIVAGCAMGLGMEGPLKWIGLFGMLAIVGVAISLLLRTRRATDRTYKRA